MNKEKIDQSKRLIKLNQIAIKQINVLTNNKNIVNISNNKQIKYKK